MLDLDIFRKYSSKKNKDDLRKDSLNCVIYTRVSGKLQVNEDGSLDTQIRMCKEYAKRNKYKVIKCFGGKNESASSDDRKEFNAMLSFVQSSSTKIKYILVYKITRFSRTGDNAIALIEKLRKKGIYVVSVTEPADTSTSAGVLLQSFHASLGRFDNDYRRDYLLDGIRKKLKAGYTMRKAPLGYDQITVNRKQVITINKKGEILRKAFFMKANEGLATAEIVRRLKALGLAITEKRLAIAFKNPYYCGIIMDGRINYEPVKGKHPALIEPQLFLRLAEEMQGKTKWVKNKDKNHLPLKLHLKCYKCGGPLTGYDVKKKNKSYYKCQTKGCNVNKSIVGMHEKYIELLKEYMIMEEYKEPLRIQLIKAFEYHNKKNKEGKSKLTIQLEKVNSDISKVKRNLATNEIDKDLYDDVISELLKEKTAIALQLDNAMTYLDSIEDYIDFTMNLATRLDITWREADLEEKRVLQNLIFPEGVIYDKEKNDYRTISVNEVFNYIAGLSRDLKNGSNNRNPKSPVLLPPINGDSYRTFSNAEVFNVDSCFTSLSEQNESNKKEGFIEKPLFVQNNVLLSNSNIIEGLIKIKGYKEYLELRPGKRGSNGNKI